MTDVAVEPVNAERYPRQRMEDGTVHFLMVGRLDAWRGFDLAVEAMAAASGKCPNIHLDIVGEGSDRGRIEKWIARTGMEQRVTLHGRVSMERYYQMMADCDVVMNPALKEGAVTTAFDSMAFGRPLIGIDTGGYTRYFHDEYAILIDRGRREQVVNDLAAAIMRMTDPELRARMGRLAQQAAALYTWEKKGEEIDEIIFQSLSTTEKIVTTDFTNEHGLS